MKKSLLTLLLLTFCFELASSKLLFFDPHSKEYITNLETNKTSISVIPDSLGITVNYSLGTIGFIACDSVESAYSIQLEDFGSSFDCLMPDLPSRIDNFKIPSDVYDIKVSLKEFEYVMCNVPICTGTEPIPCFTKDIKITPKAATTSTTLESDSIIKINYFINKRRNNHLGILISPFQYDADNNQLNIYKTFTYRVDFIYNKKQNKAIIEDNSNKDYLSIPVRESFLIISTPDYKNTIKPFAKWKQQCGFNVIEKYESTWNSNRTKSVIDSIYQNTDNLKYVLFVGDNSIVPGHYLSFDGWSNYPQWGIRYYYSDFPYSCIDNSIIPDLHIGRIPSRNLSEADNAISKILSYELSPTLSSNFYDRTLHNAIFTLDDNSIEYAKEPFVYTSEKIRDYVSSLGYNCIRNYSAPNYAMPKYWAKRYGLGEEIPKELQRPNYEWDGKISSINSEIEVGTLYVLNCGHGSKSSITLNSQSPSLYTSSLAEKLSNNNLYPIFFNMSCSTGSYEHLSYPSLTQSLIGGKYGAVAVYSASEYSCMGLNDAMAIGYFNGLWTKPGFNCQIEEFYDYYSQPEYKNTPTTLGKILEYGQLMQTAHYGLKSKFSVYNKRIFHLFGDPSMLVHTVIPNLFSR